MQPPHARRISAGQSCVLEARHTVARLTVKIEHQRTLHHDRKFPRSVAHAQISSLAVWSAGIERKTALIQRVYLLDLRRVEGGCRQSEVSVAARLRQNLHFIVDATSVSARRIRQCKVPMDKRITRLAPSRKESAP